MQIDELKEIVDNIMFLRSETQTVELKAAKDGCPKRLFDTLSSFSNQDSGGMIIFGVDEKDGYNICGVYDAQDLQQKVNEQCKQMEPAVRALFTTCEVSGKVVVSAEIPCSDVTSRPVFYKGVGRIKGSYIRVGDADELMSEYEIYSYEAFRKRLQDDIRVVEGAEWHFVDSVKLDNYLTTVKKERINLAQNVSDDDILELMGVTKKGRPTLAGMMVFTEYPQEHFPQLCITAVAMSGTEKGELGCEGERFIDNKRITGSISNMLEEAVEFVRKNSRTKTIIDGRGRRVDKTEYPIVAIRKAILNALVHRDYSIYTEGTPIRIEMYRDRIEIINSGGLYGRISIDELGNVRPETRNAALANILEVLKITENRYSGIPTMRRECRDAGLPEPKFSAEHGEFKVVIRNWLYSEMMSVGEALIEYCASPRSREEITAFVGKTQNHVMSQIVRPLVETGSLRLTLPDKPRSSKQRYVKADHYVDDDKLII